MNIRIKATNITLHPGLNDFVNKTLAKITKVVGNNPTIQCDVEIGRSSEHHLKGDVFKADIHLVGDGIDAYASAEHEDLNTAITAVRDEIVNKIRIDRRKKTSYVRRSGAMVKAMMKGLVPWGEDGWYRRGK